MFERISKPFSKQSHPKTASATSTGQRDRTTCLRTSGPRSCKPSLPFRSLWGVWRSEPGRGFISSNTGERHTAERSSCTSLGISCAAPGSARSHNPRSRRGLRSLRYSGKGGAQGVFLCMIEGSSQHDAADAFEILEHLVGGQFANKQKERRIARLQARRNLLHKGVVDSYVTQIAAECTRGGADRGTGKRHQKN